MKAVVFLNEESAFGYAVRFARILLTTSALFGVFYVLTNILSPLIGVNGLVWVQPVADILAIGLAVVLYISASKKMMQENMEKYR